MDPESEAMETERARAALRKTEAEIRSLEVNTLIAARRFWLDVGKFIIIVAPLAAGALKFLGAWL
ncbi:MAG: hypothetical protein OXP09_18800 [Gammaproteobacteria bacterium]|nr:hypothetical protein [Gammaproteobacteria bacterium]MDE0367613.1 hypothetical protein [Gammaproteobacteria bacterium]